MQPFGDIAGLQIVQVNRSELLINNGPRACGSRFEIEAVVLDGPGDLLGAHVIVEQSHRAFAIREEVNPVAHPHRVKVIGVVPWYGDDA